MSLRDLLPTIASASMEDDEPLEPVDYRSFEWPVSDLDYVIYFNLDYEPALDLASIEREMLAEIAPRHRVVRFERLTAAVLRSWSPFPTRAVEKDFLQKGFGRGRVAGMRDRLGPAAFRQRHDYLTHHEAHAESLVAMRCVGYIARSALSNVKTIVPNRERPRWLRRPLPEILTPICGRKSLPAGGDRRSPELPLASHDGLLLACATLDVRRVVHAAEPTTPGTVDRMGRRDLRGWCGLEHDDLRTRVRAELADPTRYFGRSFDPCAAALWLSQTMMALRIAVAEAERYLAANDPIIADAEAKLDLSFQERLFHDHGEENPAFCEPRIEVAGFPLHRRLLFAFFGGMTLPYDAFFGQEYAAIEELARWIGRLRRQGRATMDGQVAWALRDIVDKNLLDLDRMLEAADAVGAEDLLVDLLPVEGWDALIEAAELILAGERTSFAISYGLMGPDDPRSRGQVDVAADAVTIQGPFLMLPLHAADIWRERARRIPARGLYLD